MSDIRELIERLESAGQGSEELDRAIFLALYPNSPAGPASYSRSLDAALSLVPADAAWWEVGKICAEDSPMRHFGSDGGIYRARVGMTWGERGKRGEANTAALAICVSALRARFPEAAS